MQQRLTVVRLYYDYVVEEGLRATNPVGRGHRDGLSAHGHGVRGLIPHYTHMPWIPTDQEWGSFLLHARRESFRNRFMFALAYDAGLRREELCLLETGDVDPSARLLRLRAATTKGRRGRTVPYSPATATLFAAYLDERRCVNRSRGRLFLSTSRRNYAAPLSLWMWSKIVRRVALAADLPRFSTHTLRHLCLTDLARAGWDLHELATFAGHRNTTTTMVYVHLSGRELASKLERGMGGIHTWRATMMGEAFT